MPTPMPAPTPKQAERAAGVPAKRTKIVSWAGGECAGQRGTGSWGRSKREQDAKARLRASAAHGCAGCVHAEEQLRGRGLCGGSCAHQEGFLSCNWEGTVRAPTRAGGNARNKIIAASPPLSAPYASLRMVFSMQ